MLISPDLMRWLLLFGMLAMVILSALFLRQRRMSITAYALWGMLAIFIPILGPFMVVWIKPGTKRINSSMA